MLDLKDLLAIMAIDDAYEECKRIIKEEEQDSFYPSDESDEEIDSDMDDD